ncbi:MAG TPA: ADOP family duplicated permease, partial [Vicinamibacterales bacterium]|nr:ADOP family duplicated permease [Vicinamibacterales bacterium]
MFRQWMDAFAHDARFALRSMARTPGFTVVAVLMIALGTGANAAMFSVIDAVMLRSPFTDPERLAIVGVRTAEGRATAAMSVGQYRGLLESSTAFERVAAVAAGQRPILTGLGAPRRFNVECVTADMFPVLGSTPIAGRTFAADEDRPGGPAVVILSYEFWQREMGGAAGAVGRVVTLNGIPTTIIGIMPRRFGGPYSRNNNDGWMPAGPVLAGGSSPGCVGRANVNVFAKLKPGFSLDSAARQATDAAGIARLEDSQGKTGARLNLVSLQEQTLSELRTPLLALLGAVGLVLLIACANVANLQMERIFGRRVELAVRMALGATRARTVRQTLTENLLLAVLGGAAGVILARWALQSIVALLPGYVPHVNDIEISTRVLAVTLAVSAVAGVAVGVIPAIQGTSSGLMADLRSASRTATRGTGWIRRGLVVGQVALSLTLLVGAGLMIATFQSLRPSDPGFNATDKLTASVRLQGPAASAPAAFFGNLFERTRAIPGVRSVSGSTYVPMSGLVSIVTLRSGGTSQDVFSGIVTPNYFSDMEIPILRGRGFEERDGAGAAPVAIVNDTMARRIRPDGNALGAEVEVQYFDRRREVRQLIGILRDTRSSGSDLKARPEIYMPFAQNPVPSMNLIVRAANSGDPQIRAAIRAAAFAIDPSQVVDRIVPMQEILDARVSTPRFGAWLLGLFAGMALLLAAVGLAASIAWSVTQRTREIGVRMALGANPRHVAGLVLTQGLGLALAGVIL